ncbi:hypothetical protein SANT12839_100920 [Streptomyces antimycoticus]|uniref:Uncharacterized protein n=1 Tax=Streptomyces antimycoticus TaxID=68175 RepID=A0A4D4KRK5_9ACTN|nr:hypothetical protein SANT12839_100920 [Streptomyces antimycoticus]
MLGSDGFAEALAEGDGELGSGAASAWLEVLALGLLSDPDAPLSPPLSPPPPPDNAAQTPIPATAKPNKPPMKAPTTVPLPPPSRSWSW